MLSRIREKMSGRLVIAIVSTTIEEAAIAVAAIWGLPQLDIVIPAWGIALIMLTWATYSILTYRAGSRALRRKLVMHPPNMIDSRGVVVDVLNPDGLIKIKGELWMAESESSEIAVGRKVIVVGQERLKLTVRIIEDTAPVKK